MAEKTLQALDDLGIKCSTIDHEEVHTVQEQMKHTAELPGICSKNLFLKDKKHGMFLVTAAHDADTNTKGLAKLLGLKGKVNLRFGSDEALLEKLGCKKGAVSPLCVMNNGDNDVRLVLDESLMKAETIHCHPLQNDKTISLKPAELQKFCEHFKHEPTIIEFPKAGAQTSEPPAAPAAKPAKAPKQASTPVSKPAVAKKEGAKKDAVQTAGNSTTIKQTGLGLSVGKDENFTEWYTQAIVRAEMIEYYDISGCYILRPWSYSIWEVIQHYLDSHIKSLGVQNCYFPLFVSESALTAEKDHVEGFAPEVAWVTKSGESDLQEPIAVRPTSETIMYPAFSKWIRSHRDLPMKLNQWCNVVRWEFKYPTPFLRSREFLWQEGHTAHATREEAHTEVMKILEFYAGVYEELLAVPVIKGKKTEKEKFAGGDYTTTVEAFIPHTGRGIQGATSHCLGQNFGKMFKINFEDEDGKTQIPIQNSWGLTTRVIGVCIMVHGDDQGLVLPPRVAPIQVVIIPIVMGKKTSMADIEPKANEIGDQLKAAGIRVHVDLRQDKNPGWKYNHYEQKGVCIRLELGPRDMEKNQVRMVRRDTGDKEDVPMSILSEKIDYVLAAMQHGLLKRATEVRDSRLRKVTEWKDFVPALLEGCMVLTPWCNEADQEDCVKDRSKEEALKGEEEDQRTATSAAAKTLCIPFDQPPLPEGTPCFFTGRPAVNWTLWGRSY